MRRFLSGFHLEEAPTATHRIVVRLAAVGSVLCAAVLVVVGLITGSTHFLYEAIGPTIAAVLFALHVITGRERATVVLVEAAVVVLVSFGIWGTSETVLAALFAMWVFALSGSFFVTRHPAAYVATTALGLLLVPMVWSDETDSPLSTGITMVVAYLVGVTLLFLIRNASARSDRRFEHLFHAAPVALVEQDISEALDHIRSCGIDDADQLRAALDDVEFLRSVVSRFRITRANAKAARLAGIPIRELLGYLPPSRVHADSADAFRQQVLASWLGRPRLEIEYRTQPFTGRGQVWLRAEMMSMELDPHAARILLAITDITADKESQAALEDLVRAKDEFIASISHELRTPLTGVLGLTSALADGAVADRAEERQLLEMVRTQSQEISYLVEDLLVGARADIGTIAIRPEPIDLGDEAHRVLHSLGSPIEIVDLGGEAAAFGDALRVRQIMRNLFVNADRYGGPTKLATVRRSGPWVMFEMWDDGVGIPHDARERIFLPYGRAHRDEGTTASVGLGLSVSRQLAELMGGTLEYVYLEGSVFRLSLPAVDVEPIPTPVDAHADAT